MKSSYVIGFDIGGTRIKSGAVAAGGALLARSTEPTGFAMTTDALVQSLEDGVRRITHTLGASPAYIALGLPGAVDPDVGVVLLPGKLQVEGFPLVPTLRERTGLPVIADNDGRLSILAEARYGQARNQRWAVTITLGTGVGSGVMLDGKVPRDPRLQFGTQASHIVQEAHSDRLCITRARGTANILCSATALAMAVRDGLLRGLPSVLNETFFDNPNSIDFEAVIRGVEAGDALCQDALERWTTSLGWFLTSVTHMYAPEIIILSGGAINAADHFLDQVRAHVNNHTFRYPFAEEIPIVLTELTDYAGVLGAAALAWQQVERQEELG